MFSLLSHILTFLQHFFLGRYRPTYNCQDIDVEIKWPGCGGRDKEESLKLGCDIEEEYLDSRGIIGEKRREKRCRHIEEIEILRERCTSSHPTSFSLSLSLSLSLSWLTSDLSMTFPLSLYLPIYHSFFSSPFGKKMRLLDIKIVAFSRWFGFWVLLKSEASFGHWMMKTRGQLWRSEKSVQSQIVALKSPLEQGQETRFAFWNHVSSID